MSGDAIDVVSEKVFQYMKQLDPSGKKFSSSFFGFLTQFYLLFPPHLSASAVNILLDMHLLEDEQVQPLPHRLLTHHGDGSDPH
jgi:hypothetical protein